MNSVERVKEICKERKIPIYRLEKDLGYGNGYIGQLKKGVFPDDRLVEIAAYLNVETSYLTGETDQKNKPAVRGDNEREDLDRILRSMTKEQLLEVIAAATAKLKGDI